MTETKRELKEQVGTEELVDGWKIKYGTESKRRLDAVKDRFQKVFGVRIDNL